MRSTLLFVAVLLACAPTHAQATTPPEAPIINAWLTALLPTPTFETTRKVPGKFRLATPRAVWTTPLRQRHSPAADYFLAEASATLLTHDSNAP